MNLIRRAWKFLLSLIAREFFPPVLGTSYADCLVTDESSVWDFPGELTQQELVDKVLLLFHVDISDLAERANLAAIFDRIATHRRGARPCGAG